jgi:hypothetical protein
MYVQSRFYTKYDFMAINNLEILVKNEERKARLTHSCYVPSRA